MLVLVLLINSSHELVLVLLINSGRPGGGVLAVVINKDVGAQAKLDDGDLLFIVGVLEVQPNLLPFLQ